MSWLSSGIADIGNAWNSQPNWAKGLEIGAGALATGGLGLAAFAPEAIGLEAGGLGGFAGIGEGLFGGGAATTGGIDAITTGSAVGASQAGGLGTAAGAASPYAGLYMGSPDVAQDLAQDAAELNDPAIWGSSAGSAGGSPLGGGAAGPSVGPYNALDANAANFGGATPPPVNPATPNPTANTSGWSFQDMLPKANQVPALALSGAGLGYGMYNQYQQNQQIKKLTDTSNQQAQAAQQASQNAFNAAQPQLSMGQGFENYLATNTLPPNVDQQLAQMQKQQEAQIISGYANRNMSADPNQNSALAGDLANAQTNIQNLRTQIEQQYAQFGQQAIQTANQLIAQGLSAAQISQQLPMAMISLNQQLGQQTSAAISTFARALTPTGSGQKFQLTPAQ